MSWLNYEHCVTPSSPIHQQGLDVPFNRSSIETILGTWPGNPDRPSQKLPKCADSLGCQAQAPATGIHSCAEGQYVGLQPNVSREPRRTSFGRHSWCGVKRPEWLQLKDTLRGAKGGCTRALIQASVARTRIMQRGMKCHIFTNWLVSLWLL